MGQDALGIWTRARTASSKVAFFAELEGNVSD